MAWGFARAADARGVDIIQNCEVKGFRREEGCVTGVETTKGIIKAPKVSPAPRRRGKNIPPQSASAAIGERLARVRAASSPA